ncbi:CorA family divalent cation transporter [Mesorhizobium muleiense]|uniref:Zinc transporter n=1 Tax=Mesorhizobium muleiense TaxID=1004279 RepID=A0A1G8J698_9HYPH|nr:CorA family divalent cation transporter [Mesorhizobium muleiense]SDI26612.1 zinc transporter [Mesorhizobium muleiense]
MRARHEIATEPALPPPVRDAFLSAGHGCHIDLEGDWLYGDLPDLRHDYSAEARGLGHFRFAFNDTMLIGGRKQPLQSVDKIRKAMDNGSRKFRSPAELIEAVMGQSLDGMTTELAGLATRSMASRTASSAMHGTMSGRRWSMRAGNWW